MVDGEATYGARGKFPWGLLYQNLCMYVFVRVCNYIYVCIMQYIYTIYITIIFTEYLQNMHSLLIAVLVRPICQI